ncbi:MAG: hypothetical protein AVDCRST_MAG96-4142 [uncultured Segetibacter sp.]|uniref:Uncharacterized protein n=1 Tax=uncultured Segetibacter sp. TaxID=481133 RepID=A0A6J4U5J0_9BACT|nr:MAG: hypothetical protein AVDCRST_MAG96-4142 [uncultured Segetibacter sp.]
MSSQLCAHLYRRAQCLDEPTKKILSYFAAFLKKIKLKLLEKDLLFKCASVILQQSKFLTHKNLSLDNLVY